jgi:hypothetical protein
MNWDAGWSMILAGFMVGAVIGLFFHRDGFLGGYTSFPRRMLRLGHIALVALGMLNLIVAVAGQRSPWLVAGGVLMPAICFLTAWRRYYRHLFVVPVACLVMAVILVGTADARKRVPPEGHASAWPRSWKGELP